MSAATATSPTPVTTTTTTTTTAIPSSDLDERVLAFQALEAAEDNLQSLCASHAGTFVQVERRGKALEEGLHDLCQHLERVQALTTDALALLLQQEGDGDGEARPTLATLAEQHRVRRRTLLQHSVGETWHADRCFFFPFVFSSHSSPSHVCQLDSSLCVFFCFIFDSLFLVIVVILDVSFSFSLRALPTRSLFWNFWNCRHSWMPACVPICTMKP